MRKMNEENEPIKRRYLHYLKTAKRRDQSTVVRAAKDILRFEASTRYASFKKFRIEQVIKFQDALDSEVNKKTRKPLSKSTIRSVLSANKKFFFWLADQQGYKSRIRHSDADYFNMNAKGARVASAVRETQHPSMEQARHAFGFMPEITQVERRNKALFPPARMGITNAEFKVVGLSREPYKNANAIRQAIKEAFLRADLHPLTPHAFRQTLVK